MKIVLIGSVRSTQVVLEKLIEHDMNVVSVFGLDSEKSKNVSSFVDLQPLASSANIPFRTFTRINDKVDEIAALKPDILFVMGLSQMVSQSLIDAARLGCVGFHPTALPKGRGRAPLAWLILEKMNGAACFFKITEEADAGEIYSRTPFEVSIDDDALSMRDSLYAAMRAGLDDWLPKLAQGHFQGDVQDDSEASWFGVRRDTDGVIDWQGSTETISRLIKATTAPHPGAITYCGEHEIRIWNAVADYLPEHKGVVGSILTVSDEGFVVRCGNGNILVTRYSSETSWKPRIGLSLTFQVQSELYSLRKRIEALEKKLSDSKPDF